MPLFAPLFSWLLRTFIPYFLLAGGFVIAYVFGWLKGILFWVIVQFMTLLEMFVSWVSDGTSLFNHLTLDSIPSEFLGFALYLRFPECLSIVLSAYAIRLARKAILRF